MPLSFQRPPQSVFSQQRARKNKPIEQPIDEHISDEQPIQESPANFHDFLQFYPLHPKENNPPQQKQPQGTMPVNPLPLPRENPLQRANPLNQRRGPQPNPYHHPHNQTPQPLQNPPIRPYVPPTATPNQHPHLAQHSPPAVMPSFAPGEHRMQSAMPTAAKDTHFPKATQSLPPQPVPPTPENAAEQFRRINKNLPDGVMYEPLDEETMRILKAVKPPTSAVSSTPQVSPSQKESQPIPSPAAPTIPSEIAKTIEQLTQNERNAQIFYAGISHDAPNDTIKNSLTELAKDCEVRFKKYSEILKIHFNINFIPVTKEINTNLSFSNAISLAISEENKALATLGNLLDQVEGTSLERQVERIINKKIVGHQLLLSYTVFK